MGSMPNFREQHAEFRQAVEDRYGIELTDAEFANLGYPRIEPTKDFEAFGSFGETTREDGKSSAILSILSGRTASSSSLSPSVTS